MVPEEDFNSREVTVREVTGLYSENASGLIKAQEERKETLEAKCNPREISYQNPEFMPPGLPNSQEASKNKINLCDLEGIWTGKINDQIFYFGVNYKENRFLSS